MNRRNECNICVYNMDPYTRIADPRNVIIADRTVEEKIYKKCCNLSVYSIGTNNSSIDVTNAGGSPVALAYTGTDAGNPVEIIKGRKISLDDNTGTFTLQGGKKGTCYLINFGFYLDNRLTNQSEEFSIGIVLSNGNVVQGSNGVTTIAANHQGDLSKACVICVPAGNTETFQVKYGVNPIGEADKLIIGGYDITVTEI